MAREAGFTIRGTFYEFPTSFRLGDPVLIKEVTGMTFEEFSECLREGENGSATMAGMVAVAIWQKNTGWRRDRVVRFVETLDLDALEFTAVEEPESPLAETEPDETSPSSPEHSTESQDTSAETSSPTSAGRLGLVTGSQG